MASVNKFIALGNLTKEAELIERGESKVCNFPIAINENNYGKKETLFIDVECWGKVAENCHKYLKKGSLVFVDGKLKFSSWGSGKEKRNKISCRAFVVTDMTQKESDNKDKIYSVKEISNTEESPEENPEENPEEINLANLDEIPW